jgi:hypothetical protein
MPFYSSNGGTSSHGSSNLASSRNPQASVLPLPPATLPTQSVPARSDRDQGSAGKLPATLPAAPGRDAAVLAGTVRQGSTGGPAPQLPATQLPASQLPASQLPASQLPATLPVVFMEEGSSIEPDLKVLGGKKTESFNFYKRVLQSTVSEKDMRKAQSTYIPRVP